ncbi:hypothetical protein AXFE_29710 [Acidithrix ferrooxidans]|uniref:Uncharacterized protein n=1 Tax=Acidithrix ferrooxidans TaxID=1280514 RepID=A0A0D8HDY5_9ACTN|nr:hypothetical protein AXFE_29710 [Acidithrix ferrooxidans]
MVTISFRAVFRFLDGFSVSMESQGYRKLGTDHRGSNSPRFDWLDILWASYAKEYSADNICSCVGHACGLLGRCLDRSFGANRTSGDSHRQFSLLPGYFSLGSDNSIGYLSTDNDKNRKHLANPLESDLPGQSDILLRFHSGESRMLR